MVGRWDGGTVGRWDGGTVERWNGGTVERLNMSSSAKRRISCSRLSIRVFSRHSRVVASKRVPTGFGETVGTLDDARTRKNAQERAKTHQRSIVDRRPRATRRSRSIVPPVHRSLHQRSGLVLRVSCNRRREPVRMAEPELRLVRLGDARQPDSERVSGHRETPKDVA
jgi:hypothetical protein